MSLGKLPTFNRGKATSQPQESAAQQSEAPQSEVASPEVPQSEAAAPEAWQTDAPRSGTARSNKARSKQAQSNSGQPSTGPKRSGGFSVPTDVTAKLGQVGSKAGQAASKAGQAASKLTHVTASKLGRLTSKGSAAAPSANGSAVSSASSVPSAGTAGPGSAAAYGGIASSGGTADREGDSLSSVVGTAAANRGPASTKPEAPAVRLRRLAGVAVWALVLVLAGVVSAIVGLFRIFGESPAWFTPVFISCGVVGMLLAMMAFATVRFRGVPWMFMAASSITLLAAFIMLRFA